MSNYYLNRFAVRDKIIEEELKPSCEIIIVIPCCNEPNLISSLDSLKNNIKPNFSVEVLIVINAAENAAKTIQEQNIKTQKEFIDWKKDLPDWLKSYAILENNLPKKHAGVGLARKIGMDEAVRRFESINKNGIIACFDADAKCKSNYLIALKKHFKNDTPACSIYFEHPLNGKSYNDEVYKGITAYELHLRYYKNALKYVGFPFAYHTIGSSMAVKSSAYQKQNGMNKRKAGEDFYFLQKLIPLGNFTELNNTAIYPSPRPSDRVPFGTGKAIAELLVADNKEVYSYNFQSFIDLKNFVDNVPSLYDNMKNINALPPSISDFLNTINFTQNLQKIINNSTNKEHFVQLFFNWFNAFKVLKCVHYLRDNYYASNPIIVTANYLLEAFGIEQKKSEKDTLLVYRAIDKGDLSLF